MVKFFKSYIYVVYLMISSIVSVWIVVNVFSNTVRGNPIEMTNGFNSWVFNFMPQGWVFFTRNPREAQILIYQVGKKNIIKPYHQRHASFCNLFGLRRTSNKILTELQLIKQKTLDSLYSDMKWNYQVNKYLKIPSKIYEYKNEIFDPVLLGNFVIVYQKPVPWAWSESIKEVKMPSKVIRLKIYK